MQSKRIYQTFESFNSNNSLPYKLSISMGGTVYDSKNDQTAEDFLRQVDRLMYEEKARRKSILRGGPLDQDPDAFSADTVSPGETQSLA